jgi:hypothetical protein
VGQGGSSSSSSSQAEGRAAALPGNDRCHLLPPSMTGWPCNVAETAGPAAFGAALLWGQSSTAIASAVALVSAFHGGNSRSAGSCSSSSVTSCGSCCCNKRVLTVR